VRSGAFVRFLSLESGKLPRSILEQIMDDDKKNPITSSPLVGELINAVVDSASEFTKTTVKAAVDKYTNRAATKVKKVAGTLPKKKKTAKKAVKKTAKKSKKKAAKTSAKKASKKKASKKKRL
jgi:hypothetical protein